MPSNTVGSVALLQVMQTESICLSVVPKHPLSAG